jgi:hypothetical protein
MRRHLWMHVGLVAAILALFGLSALGVAIPTGVVYLVLLACPLMMIFMMVGMNHDQEDGSGHDHDTDTNSDRAPSPHVDSTR